MSLILSFISSDIFLNRVIFLEREASNEEPDLEKVFSPN